MTVNKDNKNNVGTLKATKAIIMAAGEGKRLRPITLETPKPLVEVNGIRMIDTVITALHENGIKDIYVVVGYMKDKFADLEKQYKRLHLIDNPYYATCNNISSLYVARKFLGDCIILDGDQMIYNKEVLNPHIEHSGYSAVWTEEETDEWLMQVKNNKVISCSRNGGNKGWQLYSVSRWTKEDGEQLRRHLEIEFEEKHNDQVYWDDIPMFIHENEYSLGIYKMNKGDVVEIDSIKELAEIDNRYAGYIDT